MIDAPSQPVEGPGKILRAPSFNRKYSEESVADKKKERNRKPASADPFQVPILDAAEVEEEHQREGAVASCEPPVLVEAHDSPTLALTCELGPLADCFEEATDSAGDDPSALLKPLPCVDVVASPGPYVPDNLPALAGLSCIPVESPAHAGPSCIPVDPAHAGPSCIPVDSPAHAGPSCIPVDPAHADPSCIPVDSPAHAGPSCVPGLQPCPQHAPEILERGPLPDVTKQLTGLLCKVATPLKGRCERPPVSSPLADDDVILVSFAVAPTAQLQAQLKRCLHEMSSSSTVFRLIL